MRLPRMLQACFFSLCFVFAFSATAQAANETPENRTIDGCAVRTLQKDGKTYIAVKGPKPLKLYDSNGNLIATVQPGTAFMFSGATPNFAADKLTLSNIDVSQFKLGVSEESRGPVTMHFYSADGQHRDVIAAAPGKQVQHLQAWDRRTIAINYSVWSPLNPSRMESNNFTDFDDRTLISLSN